MPDQPRSEQGQVERRRRRRAASARQRRLVRTILLGAAALAAALYWLTDSLGIQWRELQSYLLASLLGVALLAAAAGVAAALLAGLRWLRRR